MKQKLLLLLALFTVGLSFGQPKRIMFYYDAAGNQTRRIVVKTFDSRMTNESLSPTANDFVSDPNNEKISYFPNPVKELLTIKWVNENNNYVSSIIVYNINGQEVQNLKTTNRQETFDVNFQTLALGFYNVALVYATGETKILKIVKQ
jgi:Secretion system C-terminal sorting domain